MCWLEVNVLLIFPGNILRKNLHFPRYQFLQYTARECGRRKYSAEEINNGNVVRYSRIGTTCYIKGLPLCRHEECLILLYWCLCHGDTIQGISSLINIVSFLVSCARSDVSTWIFSFLIILPFLLST